MKLTNYFAKAIDLDDNAITIPVDEDGTIQISSSQKIKSLKTNALYVFCRNNELKILEAPNAVNVRCNKNKITSLSLQNAEKINCAENKLTELYAPKATQINCCLNKITQLKLENAIDLKCSGNEIVLLEAPKLRTIDCEIPASEDQKAITSVKEIEIELKNIFDRKNVSSYDIGFLDLEVNLNLHKELLVEDMTFYIALQEESFFSYEDESDIEGFEIELMTFDDKFGQHQNIIEQVSKLPITFNSPQKLKFSIPIFSSSDGSQNFLDIIKEAPDHIFYYEKELDLYITFYLNPNKKNEKYYYKIFKVANPFFKSL